MPAKDERQKYPSQEDFKVLDQLLGEMQKCVETIQTLNKKLRESSLKFEKLS